MGTVACAYAVMEVDGRTSRVGGEKKPERERERFEQAVHGRMLAWTQEVQLFLNF